MFKNECLISYYLTYFIEIIDMNHDLENIIVIHFDKDCGYYHHPLSILIVEYIIDDILDSLSESNISIDILKWYVSIVNRIHNNKYPKFWWHVFINQCKNGYLDTVKYLKQNVLPEMKINPSLRIDEIICLSTPDTIHDEEQVLLSIIACSHSNQVDILEWLFTELGIILLEQLPIDFLQHIVTYGDLITLKYVDKKFMLTRRHYINIDGSFVIRNRKKILSFIIKKLKYYSNGTCVRDCIFWIIIGIIISIIITISLLIIYYQ